ncbi:MAG: sporulation protein YunB [Oscillospiraceae bacterium]|nr:sporulation protein YunB [Oscillospiraceae bacterium]
MLNTEKKSKKRLGKRLVFVGAVLLVFSFFIDMRVRPLIERTGEYMCRVAAVRIINDVIYAELMSDAYNYDNLVNITYDSNGEVKSISGDMRNINRLKSRSALLINQSVDLLDAQNMGVSLGTASGISAFYGRGPVIPVRVVPKGYANVVFLSEFTSAGINQTLHRIIMEAEVDISMIIPGFNSNVTIKTDYIIAETVIVGNVPKVYAQVIAGDGEMFKL